MSRGWPPEYPRMELEPRLAQQAWIVIGTVDCSVLAQMAGRQQPLAGVTPGGNSGGSSSKGSGSNGGGSDRGSSHASAH